MRVLVASILLLISSSAANASTDVDDIRKVMDTFHDAVVSHDGARLSALFIPEGSTWLNVLESPRKVRVGSYQDFAKFVSSTKSELNPEHSHVRIQTNGTVACAYFDFVFLIDGKEQNKGAETWQLVKGPEGWRIAAITYSSEPRLY